MASAKLSVRVKFGAISINNETTSIGFKFDADGVEPEQVRAFLVKRRVSCELETCKLSDAEGQKVAKGFEDQLRCSADTGRISMGLDDYSGRIQISLADHTPEVLMPFRKREGWLRIFSSGHIPEPTKEAAE